MRIYRHIAGLPKMVHGTSVAIGNFDGVHRGHQVVIGEAAQRAQALGTSLSVVTFEPHPRRLFRPDDPPFQLTPLRSKLRRFRAMGIDHLLLIHFDQDMAGVSHEDFVQQAVVEGLRAKHVSIGYDFVFGHKRAGNADYLRQVAADRGFGLSAIEPVKDKSGVVYSSTNIRNCLREGKPAEAAQLLGRPWEIEGRVTKGDQRGRQIGFPTANLLLDEYVQPALGVYAVWVGIEEGGDTVWRLGCANIGRRPTFDGEGVVLEVYIFDFADDVYDKLMRVALVDYIRPEKKFDGVAQLREQIARDSHDSRELLEGIGDGELLSPPD